MNRRLQNPGFLLWLLAALLLAPAMAQTASRPGERLTWSLRYDPKTFDAAKVDDQASQMVRFLIGGVLLRTNRATQQVEPALAESWKVSPDGTLVSLHLRTGLRFSDGSPLDSNDVVATLKRLLNPATAAPVAEEFLEPAKVTVAAAGPLDVTLHLPRRVVSIGKVLDEIAIEPGGRNLDGRITAGPFTVAEYRRGEYLRLERNPYYWKHDSAGRPLPYLASIRMDILANRDQDELRFLRGQYALMDNVAPDNYALIAKKSPASVHDLGPSLNTEQMWFNQAGLSKLPAYEKAWFASQNFRNAVSMAIHRADLARIAYEGHATPANSFISPANGLWYNQQLPRTREDLGEALKLLANDGFHRNGRQLVDRSGHVVKFSLLTNAGNHARERMAALIQQDLEALGISVNVVTLDFPALIERLVHSFDYEAALLGLSNVEPDPSTMMNVWLSSSPTHQWNPAQKTPATPWEAEIDRLMAQQAAAASQADRKRAVDRVQQIVAEQQPFIYLVYPNALYAVSPQLTGVQLTVLPPGVVSNIDAMRWKGKP